MGSRGSAGGRNLKRAGVVENAWSLDARELQRQGLLDEDCCAGVYLRHRSGASRLIRFECDLESVQLAYTIQDTAGHTVDKGISLVISRVLKPYGGSQPYLLCPSCETRVLLVYLTNGDLVCRKCADLVHSSSRERAGDRALRRTHKLCTRLGDGGGFFIEMPARPPHMRWRTYYKTWRKISEADQALARAWLPSMRGK